MSEESKEYTQSGSGPASPHAAVSSSRSSSRLPPPVSPSSLPLSSLRVSASSPDLSATSNPDREVMKTGEGTMLPPAVSEHKQQQQAGGREKSPSRKDPWNNPWYRLAAARSSEHREQELAWQWHVYRLRTIKQKIDSSPPASYKLIRDPEKSSMLARCKSSAAFRQHEIQMANNALVARIRNQKSEYEFKPQKSEPQNQTGAIFMGSRALRMQRRKIEIDNANLLKNLQRIQQRAGPYNREKIQSEVHEHERLVRKRLPRLMHAHPNLKAKEAPQPPIHFTAARLNSPAKLRNMSRSASNSPSRRKTQDEQVVQEMMAVAAAEGVDWREYMARKGIEPAIANKIPVSSSSSPYKANGSTLHKLHTPAGTGASAASSSGSPAHGRKQSSGSGSGSGSKAKRAATHKSTSSTESASSLPRHTLDRPTSVEEKEKDTDKQEEQVQEQAQANNDGVAAADNTAASVVDDVNANGDAASAAGTDPQSAAAEH